MYLDDRLPYTLLLHFKNDHLSKVLAITKVDRKRTKPLAKKPSHQYHIVCAASGCNNHITKHVVLKTLSWSKIHTGRRWNPFSE